MEQETKSLINIGINNNNEVYVENDFESIAEDKGALFLLISALDRLKVRVHSLIDDIEYDEQEAEEEINGENSNNEDLF
jgi:hypothetical protein